MSNEYDSELERQLASALKNRAANVEPADGSYVRLRQRVASEDLPELADSGHGLAGQPRATRPRSKRSVLTVAAAFLLLLGGLGWWATNPPQTKIEAIDDGVPAVTTTATAPPEIEDDDRSEVIVVPPEPAAEVPTTTTAPRKYEGAVFTGPRRETVKEAAQAFLALVGIDHDVLAIEGLAVDVFPPSTEGEAVEPLGRLQLEEAEVVKGRPGFHVVAMTSPSISIASPMPETTVVTSPLAVVGDALSVSGSLRINLLSASDGSILAGTTATAPIDDAGAFTAQLDVSRAAWAWLVVADVDDDGQPLSLAAVPVSFIVDVDAIEYVVFDLADQSTGLEVRDIAGPDGTVVGALPPGTSGVRRQGRVPELVDGQAWWYVEATVGNVAVVGWVDSRFLIEASVLQKQDVDETDLIELGRRLAEAATLGDVEGLAGLPWAPERDIPFGWWRGLQPVPTSELSTVAFWESSREWTSPVDIGPETVTLSVMSFLDLPNPDQADIQYLLDGLPSPYGLDQQVISERFAAVRSVTVVAPDPSSDWRTVTLFVENTAQGPVIVGVGVTIGIP